MKNYKITLINVSLVLMVSFFISGCGCDKKADDTVKKDAGKESITQLAGLETGGKDSGSGAETGIVSQNLQNQPVTGETKELTPQEIEAAKRAEEDRLVAKVARDVEEMKKTIEANFLPDSFIFFVEPEKQSKINEEKKRNDFKNFAEKTMLAQYIRHMHFNVRPIDALAGVELIIEELKNESIIDQLVEQKFSLNANEIKAEYNRMFDNRPLEMRRPLDFELSQEINKRVSFEKFMTWFFLKQQEFDKREFESYEKFYKGKKYLEKGVDMVTSMVAMIDLALNGKKEDMPVIPSIFFCGLIAKKGSFIYMNLPEEYKTALDQAGSINDASPVMFMKLNPAKPYYQVSYKQFKVLPDLVGKFKDVFKYSLDPNILAFEGFHLHDEQGNHIPDPNNPNNQAQPAGMNNPNNQAQPAGMNNPNNQAQPAGQDNINDPENINNPALAQQPQGIQFMSEDFGLQFRDQLDNFFWLRSFYLKNVFILEEVDSQVSSQDMNSYFLNKLNNLFIDEYIKMSKQIDSYKEKQEFTEQELKAYFTKNIDSYKIDEMYNLSWLVFDTRAEAEIFYKKLESGESFDSLIKEKYGIEDYLPSTLRSDSIVSQISSILKNLKSGEFTPIIYVEGKFLIANILNKIEARPMNFDVVKDIIKEKLMENHKKDYENRLFSSLREEIQYKIKNIEFLK
jgi:hypothetical protein